MGSSAIPPLPKGYSLDNSQPTATTPPLPKGYALDSPAPTAAAPPSATSRFMSGAGDEVMGLLKGLWDVAKPPMSLNEAMQKLDPGYIGDKLVIEPFMQKAQSTVAAFKAGDPVKGTLGALATVNPLAPDVTKLYDQAASGDTAGAMGHGAVQIGGLLAADAAKRVMPNAPEAIKSKIDNAITEAKTAPQRAVMAKDVANMPVKAVDGAEDVFRAAAPVGSDPMFRKSVYTAAGDLAEVGRKANLDAAKGGNSIPGSPDMRVNATVQAINDHLSDMYNGERAPQVARNAAAPVVMKFSPEATEALQNIAKNGADTATRSLAAGALAEGALPLSDVDTLARVVNRETAPMRGLTSQQLAQMEGGSRKLAAAKALDAELGNMIDTELANRGEGGIKQYEQRYAALSDVRDQLQKRMNALELQRKNPIQKTLDVLGMVKNPMAGASQAATANVNIGDVLQQGLKKLSDSGMKANRAVGSGRPPVRGLLGPGVTRLGSQMEPIGAPSAPPPVLTRQ